MDKNQQEIDVLQKIADTKDMDAIFEASDASSDGGDEFFSTEDGIHAALPKSKHCWNVAVRENPNCFWNVEIKSIPKTCDKKKLEAAIKKSKLIPEYFKSFPSVKDQNTFQKRYLQPDKWHSSFMELELDTANKLKDLLELMDVEVQMEPYEDSFEESMYAFFIDTSFSKVKKRLEALSDRKLCQIGKMITTRKIKAYERSEDLAREVRKQISEKGCCYNIQIIHTLLMKWMRLAGKRSYDKPKRK